MAQASRLPESRQSCSSRLWLEHGRQRWRLRGPRGQAAGVPASLATGPDRALVPEMEWMSQALLMVDAVDAGNVVEVTVFARPAVQRQVKTVLLSQASVHREQRARAEKMEQLEEFLKAQAPGPQVPQHPVA
ncbi:oocyte-expressed protein homolog isoform X2 [Bubalus bubalis]|uniref:oocyte-expressed protein homolog isoform X2 n=1 Tax=Bubalus bubalis TaxID=89462 RepID=UPI001E1B649B|nr:oocyte-expressed protein homolog isoform X2 [Bubalus bubalis]